MIKEKRAQFYLLAAAVIIVLMISIVAIRNQVNVKDKHASNLDLGNTLEIEGLQVIDSSNYNPSADLNTNLNSYLGLFADYVAENTDENFNLIVLYGSSEGEQSSIKGKIFTTYSPGTVSANVGPQQFQITPGAELNIGEISNIQVNKTKKEIEIVIDDKENDLKINQKVPVLDDNNFLFLMTTSDGFNQYVDKNFK
jgi:hypothetical protein